MKADSDLVRTLQAALEQDPLEVLASLLAGMRPMDIAAAREVVGREPLFSTLGGKPELFAKNAGDIAARLGELAQAAQCLRCGTCCRRSSPTLYKEDLVLVERGLDRDKLYALRKGERVGSARLGTSGLLETPLVKVREEPGGACVYLHGSLCAIYPHSPLQCRHLECWSQTHAGQLSSRPRLEPEDLFAGDETALNLAREYGLKIPAQEVTRALEDAVAGDSLALKEAQAVLEHDSKLRTGINAQYCYTQTDLDLLLGRPVWEVATTYGFALTQRENGMLRLEPVFQ